MKKGKGDKLIKKRRNKRKKEQNIEKRNRQKVKR